MNTWVLGWLVALPTGLSPLVYLCDRLCFHVKAEKTAQNSITRWVGLVALIVMWIPFLLAFRHFQAYGPLSWSLGSVMMRLDGLSLLLTALALALGTLVALYSGPNVAGVDGEGKYYALLIIMTGAIIGMACAGDLFNLWVWFEAMAIASYMLVAFHREQPASLEAGVKYLVQSAVGSVMVVLGIALVLADTGTLDLAEIRVMAQVSPMLLAAGALFTIGFGVKIALVPLHTWLPDAHSQAPSAISAMLSGVVIETGLIALLRALAALAGIAVSWGVLLMGFGALNMLVGNLLALRQTQVKRLLAYSSISQVGYMLLGLGIGIYAGQSAGVQGGLFHLLNHGLMKGLAFLAAGALLYALYTAVGQHGTLTIYDLSGAAHRYPLEALALSLAVLALAGLPPLAGFMSKWQILAAGIATHNPLIATLVVFAALNSVLSLAYYAPMVNTVYRCQPSMAVQRGRSVPTAMKMPLILLALAVVAIGLWPALLNWLTEPASAAVVSAFGG